MTPEWAKTAKIGDKVVCVSEYSKRPEFGEIDPIIGKIYTIREIFVMERGEIFFLFDEIRNAPEKYSNDFGEVYFCASRLKPVQTSKTDISIFHEILKSVSERI